MSIESITSQVRNAEQYVIRSEKSENSEQVSQDTHQQVQPSKTDEYDKANPVGEEAEGIYSVSYDEDGSLKVDYKQPAAKSEGAGQAAGGTQSAESTDDTEEEIEQLKRQRDQIKQQLNKEKDEEARKVLRTQLQAIEAQIAQKTAELNG